MNYLIVYMHPVTESFNGEILKKVIRAFENKGSNIKIRNLYQESFQSSLTREEYEDSFSGIYRNDVLQEQKFIDWADHILMIFPVWWGGFPAIGKGYIDRVFSFGYAYELEGESPIPKLTGKKASLLYTTGAPKEVFSESGMNESMVNLVDKSILQFCGISLQKTLHFGNVIQCTNREREAMLQEATEFVNKLVGK